MTGLWQRSLLFRRLVTLSVLLFALSAVYIVAALFPPKVSLPSTAAVKLSEVLHINGPKLDEGDAVLSYGGVPDETAEVWLDQASLTGSSLALLGAAAPVGPQPMVYTVADASRISGEKQCRTTIVVRRAQGAPAPQTLELMQRDPGSGDQQFRQVLLRAPGAVLQVEVHTDAAVPGPGGMTLCPRVVRIGKTTIDWPAGPLFLLVQEGWINLRFNSADPNHPAFSSNESTLDGVSLGDDDLEARGIDVISAKTAKPPVLHFQAHDREGTITLQGLKLAARGMQLDVGVDTEVADESVNGKRYPPAKPQDVLQSNPALSAVVGALMAGLIAWVTRVWFPGKGSEAAP